MTATELRPQRGPQETFLASPTDLAVFGGSAGGGKSYALLLQPLLHARNPRFGCVIFRRTYPEIMGTGGLWDTAAEIYPGLGAVANKSERQWRFPSGATVAFRHLEHETDVYAWQGSQIPLIGLDELTRFTARQVFYLFSRNRSLCGVRPYLRATCNPDAGSWVAEFLSWWIDAETGYPYPDRAGRVRYFYRKGDDLYWFDSRAGAEAAMPELAALAPPKSVTFIPSKLTDNQILMTKDPGYYANLLALPWVERARLLDGNWKVTAADGLFRREWFGEPVKEDALPRLWKRRLRAWDVAATEAKDANDPDWTVGVLMGQDAEGRYWVLDVQRARYSPQKVKALVRATAERDGREVEVVVEQEPGAAGKILAHDFRQELAGFNVAVDRPDKQTGDKVARAYPFSAACEQGKVWLAAGGWVKAWLAELTVFPSKGVHDDQVDASSTAFRRLARGGGFAV